MKNLFRILGVILLIFSIFFAYSCKKEKPTTVPDAPTIGTAIAGNAQAVVTFTAPLSNGGSAITGYTVTSNPGNITGTGTASPITITGLTNGTAYNFTVRATNAIGTSVVSSASNLVTPTAPLTVPEAPTIGTASAGNAQAVVTFTAPLSNGGSAITGYTVTSSPGNIKGTGSASPITVIGLTNGTTYTFMVTATNAIGSSIASSTSNSVIPLTVPGAPTIGTATAGNAQVVVTFTALISNGGSPITGYTLTSVPGGLTGTSTSSPITLTGLTNGTAYTFTVTATNVNGTGAASSASNSIIPSTIPGPPIIGTASAGTAQAIVTFTAPVSNGGSSIISYTATSVPSGFIGTGTSSPIKVTGLTNGTAYTFTLTATNSIGTSVASSASNSVTPLMPIADIDGNVYNIVTIGTQVWMAENLKTTKYNDGTAIPNIIDNTIWAATTTGAYGDYNNTPQNSTIYGRLYNWYAVDNSSPFKVTHNGGKNVCPTSWHVPSDAEWTILTTFLGGEAVAGGKLKETGTTHWLSPNSGATNEMGFTALPGGYRYGSQYNLIGSRGSWWSTSMDLSYPSYAWSRVMSYLNDISVHRNSSDEPHGFSVRCVRDF